MKKDRDYIWKLGMFIIIGILLFIVTIYLIGKNKNFFVSTFHLTSHFKNVSGLKEGNNVRFSGINVGTVKEIAFLSDTSVVVNIVIKKEVQQYLKKDAVASIGSDGLMGDKILTLSPGSTSNERIQDHDVIASTQAVDMEDLMKSVQKSVDNAGIITEQLAQFSYKMNNKKGLLSKLTDDAVLASSIENTLTNLETTSNEFASFTKKMNQKNGVLSKLVNDEKLGQSIDSSIYNIQQASKGLNENMEAAQHNFLLRGYFNKKKKAEAKKQKELIKLKSK